MERAMGKAPSKLTNTSVQDAPTGVPSELLTVREVAYLLGRCSLRHVYRLSDANRMPRPIKLGALTRWRRTEILNWIAAGCPGDASRS